VIPSEVSNNDNVSGSEHRSRQVQKLRIFLHAVSTLLDTMFDRNALIHALLSFQVDSRNWTSEDEKDKSRLIYQCVTLFVMPFFTVCNQRVRMNVLHFLLCRFALNRRYTHFSKVAVVLTWFCTEYGQHFSKKGPLKRANYYQDGFDTQRDDNMQ
jgi:hypothetical protein